MVSCILSRIQVEGVDTKCNSFILKTKERVSDFLFQQQRKKENIILKERLIVLWFGKRSFRRHQSCKIKCIILSINMMDLNISGCVDHLFFSIFSSNSMSLQIDPLCSKQQKERKGKSVFVFLVLKRKMKF